MTSPPQFPQSLGPPGSGLFAAIPEERVCDVTPVRRGCAGGTAAVPVRRPSLHLSSPTARYPPRTSRGDPRVPQWLLGSRRRACGCCRLPWRRPTGFRGVAIHRSYAGAACRPVTQYRSGTRCRPHSCSCAARVHEGALTPGPALMLTSARTRVLSVIGGTLLADDGESRHTAHRVGWQRDLIGLARASLRPAARSRSVAPRHQRMRLGLAVAGHQRRGLLPAESHGERLVRSLLYTSGEHSRFLDRRGNHA